MKFYDKVNIKVISGRGGDGLASWRREAKVPFGWPSWGDGWKGGSIILESSEDVNTLMKYRNQKHFKANSGEPGRSKDQYGKWADDKILKVPVGTIVRDTQKDKVVYQFLEPWKQLTVAKWWKWWLGNIHFKNSTIQYPNMFLKWEPGETRQITLELQLLGDLALIGAPSVGKSSIINMISNVKAKTAEYHFTTLVPKIGVVDSEWSSFTVVDIPWLIQWASKWKWLGNEFLRHVLKAKVWAFVLDINRYEKWVQEFIQIFEEIQDYVSERFMGSDEFGFLIKDLERNINFIDNDIYIQLKGYNQDQEKLILKKKFCIILNKYDLLQDQEILNEYWEFLIKEFCSYLKSNINNFEKKSNKFKNLLEKSRYILSAATRKGIDSFVKSIWYKIQNFDGKTFVKYDTIDIDNKLKNYIKDVTDSEIDKLAERWYIDSDNAEFIKVWEVWHPQLAYYVYVLPWWNEQAVNRFWKKLQDEWIIHWFQEQNIYKWDVLKIVSPYHGQDDKYIMYT